MIELVIVDTMTVVEGGAGWLIVDCKQTCQLRLFIIIAYLVLLLNIVMTHRRAASEWFEIVTELVLSYHQRAISGQFFIEWWISSEVWNLVFTRIRTIPTWIMDWLHKIEDSTDLSDHLPGAECWWISGSNSSLLIKPWFHLRPAWLSLSLLVSCCCWSLLNPPHLLFQFKHLKSTFCVNELQQLPDVKHLMWFFIDQLFVIVSNCWINFRFLRTVELTEMIWRVKLWN